MIVLKTQTWRDIEEKINEKTVAVIPIGSIEQHGLHAPLGTDYFVADGFAKSLEENENVLMIPTIPVGVAEYHRHFAGSLWVKPETLKNYIKEIIKSFAFHGVKKVIIVNGHGGNREPLKEMGRFLKFEEGIEVAVWTWFEGIEKDIIDIFGVRPPLHADETETAMLMNFVPEYVQTDFYEESAAGSSDQWGKFHNGTMVSQEVRDFSRTGATGDPSKTDQEIGKKMLELSKEDLKKLVDYMSDL